MADEIKKEEVKDEVKIDGKSVIEETRADIVLMAKIDKEGRLVDEMPQDLRAAAYLLMHLSVRIQSRQIGILQASQQLEAERKKPNIITSIKNSPIIKGLYK